MIDLLSSLDPKVALGVLARAALALDHPCNPAAKAVIADELILREKIISAARQIIGLSSTDSSPDAIEKIGDFLDQQADGLVGPSDIDGALLRLSESGSLPSDMYEIHLNNSIRDWMGSRYELEQILIETTIRFPDQEKHYGRSNKVNEPSLVSLFYRRFNTTWPYKDFNLLVVAARNGLVLSVSQVWRIYPSIMNISGSNTLVDILRIFANEFGKRIDWEGKTGSFFLTVDKPVPKNFSFAVKNEAGKRETKFEISQITQIENGRSTGALVVVIDLTRYLAMFDQMSVSKEHIVNYAPTRTNVRMAS